MTNVHDYPTDEKHVTVLVSQSAMVHPGFDVIKLFTVVIYVINILAFCGTGLITTVYKVL